MFTFLQIMPKIVHFGEFLKAFCETVLPEKPIQKRPKNGGKLIRFALEKSKNETFLSNFQTLCILNFLPLQSFLEQQIAKYSGYGTS